MAGNNRVDSVADEVGSKMLRGFISPRALLSKMSVVDNANRTSTVYQDPNYLPFYFHLGRTLDPRSVFCLGVELGLQVGCLLEGCAAPQRAACLQPKSEGFYSPRIALSNIKSATNRRFPVSIHVGEVGDEQVSSLKSEKFDLAMIVVPMPVDSLMDSMEFCWSALREDGIMVVDMLDEKKTGLVFSDFCRARNLPHHILKTRYGTGIVGR